MRSREEYMTCHNNNDKKECEGCTTNKFCNLDPSYTDPKTNKVTICPCVECIVKVTCHSLPCKEYAEYIRLVHNIK